MASLKDVAKLANVSLMTVSRALNSPERLKAETLARVQAAIEQTNYVPDLSAKKIRGARATPSTIGVLALDTVTTPFSVEITLSIEETARAHGWNSFVVNSSRMTIQMPSLTCYFPTARTASFTPPWGYARFRYRRNC